MALESANPVDDLVTKPNGKSEVWKYFGLKVNSDGKAIDNGEAICRTCRRTVVARNGNTSNLKSHLKNNHKALYSQMEQITQSTASVQTRPKNQLSITASFESTQPYSHQSKRWKDLNTAVAYFICKDRLPIYTVEKEGFRALLKTLDSRYEVPSRVHFSRSVLPELYASTKSKVAQLLKKVKSFAGTTDLWSSVGLKPYLGYTIHFIDDNWKLHSLALSTSFLPEDHTANNIADALQDTLEEWHLNSTNQVCLTTDSASNMVLAADHLKWTRISCFGHNLHLGVTKALARERRCSRALAVAHKIVSSFSCSWKRQRELSQAQVNMNLPKHSLISDCQTRWGSTQKMVERILEQESAIRVVLSADRKASHLLPTWQDIEVLKSINATLQPLANFTDVMSGETYVTSSTVLPIIHLLTNSVLKNNEEDPSLTNDLRAAILEDMLGRNTSENVLHLLEVASFLDPRFKTKFVRDHCIDAIKETIYTEAISLLVPSPSDNSTSNSISSPSRKKRRTLGSLLKDSDEIEDSESQCLISPEQQIMYEVQRFLSEPKLDEEEDPLKWWQKRETDYMLLSQVVKKYFSIPATSTPSERLFSRSGQIVTPLRSSLNPTTVQMLVFLSMNL